MKKIFIAILLLICSYTTYAQTFGIQAGVRINTAGIEYPGVNISRKAGFEGGISYQYPISVLPLTIRAALLYSNNRFTLKNDLGNNMGITYNFEENNLKLPLTVEWKPLPGIIKPFLKVGLYTSYSFSGKIKESDSSNSLKYKNNSHKMDYGSIVGIGAYFTKNIAFSASYEHGFVRRDMVLGNQFVSVRERGCLFTLNYLF